MVGLGVLQDPKHPIVPGTVNLNENAAASCEPMISPDAPIEYC
jgi:hypothetical protein